MEFIKNLIANHKIKTSFVGGVLVVATAYGTCSFDPDENAIKDAALGEKETEQVEDKKEDPKEEPKEDEKETSKDEKKEEDSKTEKK